jgi:hypothetical protein
MPSLLQVCIKPRKVVSAAVCAIRLGTLDPIQQAARRVETEAAEEPGRIPPALTLPAHSSDLQTG